MFKGILTLLGSAFSFLNLWKRGKEREKDRQSGEDRANLRHLEGNLEASQEMRGIEDATRRLTPAARRSALRRFMSDDNDEGDNGR